MTEFELEFQGTDERPLRVVGQFSVHKPGSAFLRISNTLFGGSLYAHLSKDDVLELAYALRDLAESTPSTLTYRGVVVPPTHRTDSGIIDPDWKAGVDSVLNTVVGSAPGGGKCDTVRSSGRWPNFPCVLNPGHEGPHRDRDQDDFVTEED